MNETLVGSHYVLAILPIWASSVCLYMMTFGVIYVARDLFEGLPYQVSYSAQLGDIALIGVVLVAATILQRRPALPGWLVSGGFHALAGVAGVAVGAAWRSRARPDQIADIYHHVVVAPLFVYLAITLAPVVVTAGTGVEQASALAFGLVWLGLVVFDVRHDRLNQRPWLERRGLRFKSGLSS